MNRRKKAILWESTAVLTITVVAVLAMVVFKDKTNQREAVLAMQQLGAKILAYRQKYGAIPPENVVDNLRPSIQGNARLGTLYYRARWIGLDAKGSEILAYTYKRYRSPLVHNGTLVLYLDGRVSWLTPHEFQILLNHQQSDEEKRAAGNDGHEGL